MCHVADVLALQFALFREPTPLAHRTLFARAYVHDSRVLIVVSHYLILPFWIVVDDFVSGIFAAPADLACPNLNDAVAMQFELEQNAPPLVDLSLTLHLARMTS